MMITVGTLRPVKILIFLRAQIREIKRLEFWANKLTTFVFPG